MSDWALEIRRACLDNGPRFGVNDHVGPWPSGPVFAWFVYAGDATAYATPLGLQVWDLVTGARLTEPAEATKQ
jgi:hypothetical protein